MSTKFLSERISFHSSLQREAGDCIDFYLCKALYIVYSTYVRN